MENVNFKLRLKGITQKKLQGVVCLWVSIEVFERACGCVREFESGDFRILNSKWSSGQPS